MSNYQKRLKEIRAVAAKYPEFIEAVIDSVARPYLKQVLSRLKLKDEGFNAATQEAMDQCLTALKKVDDTIESANLLDNLWRHHQ